MKPGTFSELTLPIEGAIADGWPASIGQAIFKLPGIKQVAVSGQNKEAVISYDPKQVDLLDLERAVVEAGFGIRAQNVILEVQGMHCATCILHVESALTDLPGVLDASVSLKNRQAKVRYIPTMVTTEGMERAVQLAGYKTALKDAA